MRPQTAIQALIFFPQITVPRSGSTEVDAYAAGVGATFLGKEAGRRHIIDLHVRYKAHGWVYVLQTASFLLHDILAPCVSAYLFHLIHSRREGAKGEDRVVKRIAAILRSHHSAIDTKLNKLGKLEVPDDVPLDVYRERLQALQDAKSAAPALLALIKAELKNDPKKEERRIKNLMKPRRRKSDGADR